MSDMTNGSICTTSVLSKNFETCSSLSYYFIAVSLSINIILGLPVNCYVLWLSVKEMIQRQSTEIFIFNTALVEIIFCGAYVFVIPHYFFNCMDCEVGAVVLGLVLLVGRPLFQTFICVERYLGVLHPMTFLKFKPMKYRIAISVVAWALVVCSCALVTAKIIGLYQFILSGYLAFFSIKLSTCLMVLKALLRPGPGNHVKKRNRMNQDKLKAFWIILIVLASSVLAYGPSTSSLVLYYFTDRERFLLSWSISLSFGLMSGFVQPFLYLQRVGKLPFCHKK